MLRKLLLILAVSASALLAQFSDALLAIVDDTVITAYEVQVRCRHAEGALRKEFTGKALEDKIVELRRKTLEAMIDRELIYLEFKSMKASIPVDYIQSRLNKIIMNNADGNVERFETMLSKDGMSLKEFREQLIKDLAVEMLKHEKMTRGNIISDREVEVYYNAQKDKLAKPGKYHLAVIQLKKNGKYAGKLQETCKEIKDKVMDGASFEDLAKLYSEGANAENGGDQGWMEKPAPKLMEAVAKLKPGQMFGGLVDLGSSIYLVKLLDLEKGGIPELNAEYMEKLRGELEKIEEEKRYRQFIRELYMKYPVKRMDGVEN